MLGLYVLDCEIDPDSRGRYRVYCVDDTYFRFHTVSDVQSRRSPGDRMDIDDVDLSGLQYDLHPMTDVSEVNLPSVIRKVLIDREGDLIGAFDRLRFSTFPYDIPEIRDAFEGYPESIGDFRDLSAVLRKDAVSYMSEVLLRYHGLDPEPSVTDTLWNPDGSTEFEFAEKLNGSGRIALSTEFYSRSSDRGYGPAKEFLSSGFLKGIVDSIMDEDTYRRCLIIDAYTEGGDPNASYHLACHHEENLRHNNAYKGITATKVVDLYKRAQSAGNEKASFRLGNIYQYGLGRMAPNLSKAVRAYRKCGDHPDALFRMATCYESTYDYVGRKGVDKVSAKEICSFYRRSAELGNRYARNRLTISDPSEPMAFTEARLLAHAEDPYAMYVLAQCYECGTAGSVSYDNAIDLYRRIIDSSSPGIPVFADTIVFGDDVPEMYGHDIMFRIGELYEKSILREFHLAFEWYSMSAESGNVRASELLDVSDPDSIPTEEYLRRLLLRSEEGDPLVIANIARCYEFGIGTRRDRAKARSYREMLAEGGDPESQYWVASYLEAGAMTEAQMSEALSWYRRASENGHADAARRIDLSGLKDLPDGELFAKCKLFMYSDDPDVQYALGHCYEFGHGVSTSFALARFHYQRAMDLGSDGARDRLDRSRIHGSVGQERYRRLMLFSDDDDPEIHHMIGSMYLDGDVVERSESLAFDWFESAANLGHIDSARMCADMVASGSVQRPPSAALSYYRKAADSGDMASNRVIGRILTEAGSDPKHHPEAVRRLRLAAHDGDPEAQYLLGRMFEKGMGMPRFYAEAHRWYQLSSRGGCFESKYRLMLLTNAGRGTKKDKALSRRLLDELRSADAERLLRHIDHCVRGKDRLTIEFRSELV